jgi:hypothetical protein
MANFFKKWAKITRREVAESCSIAIEKSKKGGAMGRQKLFYSKFSFKSQIALPEKNSHICPPLFAFRFENRRLTNLLSIL